MPAPDLIQISNEIYTYAALLLKFFSESLEERLQNHGVPLTSLQFSIVRMLRFEPLTISMISQRMSLDPSALVRIIDSLERKGLVLRAVDPHDRRRNPIEITKKGLKLVAAVPVIAENDPVFHALQSLGVEPTVLLRDLLLKVMQQFPEGRLVSELISGQPGRNTAPTDGVHDGNI